MDEHEERSSSTPESHEKHDKIKQFAKILIALECPFSTVMYYNKTRKSVKVYRFVGYDPTAWANFINIFIFSVAILAIGVAVISDSYFTKYYAFVLSFMICLVASVLSFVAHVMVSAQMVLKCIAVISLYTYEVMEPLRVSLFFDQLPPKMAGHQAGHVFLMYQEMKTLGSLLHAMSESFMKDDDATKNITHMFLSFYMSLPFAYLLIVLSFYKVYDRGLFSYEMGIECMKCFVHAFNLRVFKREQVDDHWLDNARGAFDARTIRNTKIMSSLIFIYATLFTYGMTSNLMKTTWSDQTRNLIEDRHLKTWYRDVTMIHSTLTIVFLPIIEYVLLPIWGKYRKPLTELQRIGITVFLTGISFVSTTVLQLEIEKYTTIMPQTGYAQVRIFNLSPYRVELRGDWAFEPKIIEPTHHIEAWNLRCSQVTIYKMNIGFLDNVGLANYTALMEVNDGVSVSYLIGTTVLTKINDTDPIMFTAKMDVKADHVRLYLINYNKFYDDSPILVPNSKLYINGPSGNASITVPEVNGRAQAQVYPGVYEVPCPQNLVGLICGNPSSVTLNPGGLYAIAPLVDINHQLTFKSYMIVRPAVYSIFYMLPQIAMLAFADAMGKIPINVFIYKESPLETRSTSLALYYFLGRDSSSIIFFIFSDVFRFRIDSFQLVLVTGLHMVFCFIFVYAALRHPKFTEDDGGRRRRAILRRQRGAALPIEKD